jgi:hypothetical protein
MIMKRFLQLSSGMILICLLASALPLSGQILMLDNFNYPAGEFLTDHNWIQQQTTATNPVSVNNAGLTYPGYVGSGIGNAVPLGVEGQDVFRGFVKQTQPGTIYMAFLVSVTTATTSGDFFISLKESATSPTNANYRGRVWVKADGSNNLAFGVTKGAMTAPMVPNYTGFDYSLGTTYLLVMKFTIVEGTTPNDSAQLFINPVIGNPEPAPKVICPDVLSGTDLGLGSVLLRQGAIGSSPSVIVDGVRVSKTWATALTVSNIATLSDLKVDGVTVTGFSPTVYAYNDTVPSGQTSVTIASSQTCWAASTNTTVASSIPGYSIIQVTAENGSTTGTYTITHAYGYHAITVSAAPDGSGTATGGGVYGQGFLATVAAVPVAGYMFNNWTDGGVIVCGEPVYTFTVQGPRELVANFLQIMYVVAATPVPAMGGSVDGTGTYPYGSNVTLTAVPSDGYIFDHWTENGTTVGTDPVYVFNNLSGNHIMEAVFIESASTYTVTGVPTPSQGGTVTGSGNVPAGDSITLTAAANTDYAFDNWTENGTILGTDPAFTLTNVQSNHTILANFHSTVGFEDPAPAQIQVYPTIASADVSINSSDQMSEIQVFGMDGKCAFQRKIYSTAFTLQVGELESGTYLVRILTSRHVYNKRIVVLK